MSTEPVIVERAAQAYVAVRGLITMQTFSEVADRLPGVIRWLGDRGVDPAGPPQVGYPARLPLKS